jgi:adenylate cyclase
MFDVKKTLDYKYNRIIFILVLSLITLIILMIAGFYSFLDNSSYDFSMKYVKKPIKQDDSLLLVDIDDNTMNSDFIPYSWPFPRFIHGDAVEVFADFGAKAVIYDIEFLNKSPAGVNIDKVKAIKKSVGNNIDRIKNDFRTATSAISNYSMKINDLPNMWESFDLDLSDTYSRIIGEFDSSIEDNDLYFAKRISYNGNVFGTVNMLNDPDLDVKDIGETEKIREKKYLQKFGIPEQVLLKDKKSHPSIIRQNVAEFPYDIISDSYKGVGFTKVDRDSDAVLRSINLFMEKDGYIMPQISLKPFLSIYNIKPEEIDMSSRDKIVLKQVAINGKTKDIKIPIYKNKMLINIPGKFDEIFIYNREEVENKKEKPYHLSYAKLLYYKYVILNRLGFNLDNLSQFVDSGLLSEYADYNNYKNNLIETGRITPELRHELDSKFDLLLSHISNFTSDANLKQIESDIDSIIKSGTDKSLTKDQWKEKKKEISDIFGSINNSVDAVYTMRAELKKNLENKICFVGLTSTATTDMGPTAFQKDFLNVGIHPSIFNTILQQDFLYRAPEWMILLLTVIFFFFVMLAVSKKNAAVIASAGVISIGVIISLSLIVFRFTNIFITPVIPLLFGLTSFVIMILLQFMMTESEKRFIRNTFNRYLSPAVIQELMKDPKKVELGGERRHCSAMFTDIEGFSSFSEQFMEDPKGLVNLLNQYLSAMSDIILENSGTIDKYEGDAIIAFFGAPHELENHAYNACISSLKMKQIEKDLNRKLLDEKIISKPLRTRIGINTGDMFVGNMGTANRLDYTMMGHSVNLAARLEGVNKQYNTYQLISEFTYEKIKDRILTRKLDRVRVVNIKIPIRLYELVSTVEEKTKAITDFLESFENALTEFENQNFNESLKLFLLTKDLSPEDAAIDIYIDRCRKFIKTPPADGWDGVYNLTMK